MNEVRTYFYTQTESVQETNSSFKGIDNAIENMRVVIRQLNDSGSTMEKKKDELVTMINNLSAASEEYAAGTEEAAASVEEQSASIDEIAKSSEALAKLAEDLQNAVSQFKYS